jgi:hypothetical protein
MLDNGGHWLLPSVIDLVQDRTGRVIYQKGVSKGAGGDCAACFVAAGPSSNAAGGTLYRNAGPPDPAAIPLPNATYADNAVLYKPTRPDPLVTPEADSEIVAMMQGVVQRGTGTAVAAVGKPLAGKTGTTSDWFDAWFVGFSPDLVAGVFVGFDDPRTLGQGEVGGHVAAPIFRDFMEAALKDVPAKPFPVAPGAALVASASSRMRADARAGSSRWSNDDVASLDEDNTDLEPVELNNGMRSERDYSGAGKRRRYGWDARDAASPVNPEDSQQPWVIERRVASPATEPPYSRSSSFGERSPAAPNSAEHGPVVRGAQPPVIATTPTAPGSVPPTWPGYATRRVPGYAAAQPADSAPNWGPPAAMPSWTPAYPATPKPGFPPPPPGYMPQYAVPAWAPR